jgi:hypothetical protein
LIETVSKTGNDRDGMFAPDDPNFGLDIEGGQLRAEVCKISDINTITVRLPTSVNKPCCFFAESLSKLSAGMLCVILVLLNSH